MTLSEIHLHMYSDIQQATVSEHKIQVHNRFMTMFGNNAFSEPGKFRFYRLVVTT